jgi:hypothetical protein
MLIKFKNKNQVALNKMLADGQRLGGIPSHIEVSSAEAMHILLEINKTGSKDFSFTSNEVTNVDVSLLMRVRDIKQSDLSTYLSSWKKSDWSVTYKKVALIIVDVPPQREHLHG